jgi:predicted dehydrogenase
MNAGAPLRLAIVGGHRGRDFDRAVGVLEDKVRITAVCDLSGEVLGRWKARYPALHTFSRFDDLLQSDACDAVYLATPLQIHARQAIAALQAGKHVLSEVVAAHTLEDCWALVEAVEASRRTYMLAENYCYMRANMMVLHMVEHGLFGDLTYAEGGYIHDCRDLLFTPAGDLTWRGELLRDTPGNFYPTHSLGPVAQWLGINRRDRLVETVTFVSRNAAASRYAADRFGRDHPAAAPTFFAAGDSAVTLIHTESGALITLRVDCVSARPHNMTHYVLQGIEGAYLSPRTGDPDGHADDPLVWIAGRSPGISPPATDDEAPRWQSLWEYAAAYEHPLWVRRGQEARASGHGGGDFLVLEEFCDAVRAGTCPPVDVYDAVTWSSILPLSIQSVQQGGHPVPVPDFARGRR